LKKLAVVKKATNRPSATLPHTAFVPGRAVDAQLQHRGVARQLDNCLQRVVDRQLAIQSTGMGKAVGSNAPRLSSATVAHLGFEVCDELLCVCWLQLQVAPVHTHSCLNRDLRLAQEPLQDNTASAAAAQVTR
jgi:hypothetical protein